MTKNQKLNKMRKSISILFFLITSSTYAQEFKQIPMITVTGEGKIKIIPDEAMISISIETKGAKSDEVKLENDKKMDAILKFIKKINIAKEDFQTQRISLHPNFDYEKKKYNYSATQSIQILLRDLTKYDTLMEGIIGEGINRIDNVEFKSSNMIQLQSEARKLAMKDAKSKAEDYVSVLGQKVGKAISISDNSQIFVPQTHMYATKSALANDIATSRVTLAAGEIEITANVNVIFALD